MSLKVFIPVPKSQIIDLKTGEMAPEWYLFFSRTIGGSTLSDAELLAALDTDVDVTAIAAQNAADEARLLAHAFDFAAEISELKKEVQNLRLLIETT